MICTVVLNVKIAQYKHNLNERFMYLFHRVMNNCNYIFENIVAENRTKMIQFKYVLLSTARLCTWLNLYGLETFKYSF